MAGITPGCAVSPSTDSTNTLATDPTSTTIDAPLLDCGIETLTSQSGPFNPAARECFADAIKNGTSARLRLIGFDEEGGRVDRTLKIWANRAEETIVTADLGAVTKTCTNFRIVDGPAGNLGFNRVGCDEG